MVKANVKTWNTSKKILNRKALIGIGMGFAVFLFIMSLFV